MRKVIIASPLPGVDMAEQAENTRYLELCIRDCLQRGESPYAAHRMLEGLFDREDPEERGAALEAATAWWDCADAVVFYTDRGWSKEMQEARVRAADARKQIELRALGLPQAAANG